MSNDIEREAFEKRFPVPGGIFWNEVSEQYDAAPGGDRDEIIEIYHGQWIAWQAARGRGDDKPFAYYRRGQGHEMLFASDIDGEFVPGDDWTPLYTRPTSSGGVPGELPWISVDDRLPSPQRRTRRNRNGVLVMFDNGNVSHITEVTETLVANMKHGPRQPLKYEAPTPARILYWLYVDDNSPLPTTQPTATGAGVPDEWRDVVGRAVEALGIMDESEGIAGWHLNGDVSPWDEGDLPGIRDELSALLTTQPTGGEWPAMPDKFYEGLGWMHAECCAALDRGEDPRTFEVGDMVKRCIHDLTQPPQDREGGGSC